MRKAIQMSRRDSRASRSSKTAKTEPSVEHVGSIEFLLERKKVKNLNLRVRPNGVVHVSAPVRMTLKQIREFVASKEGWISRIRKENSSSPMAVAERASDAEKRQWKEIVSSFAPLLVEEWEGVLGVNAKKLVYRNMKSRWGSCQPETGRICLNTRLALYPPECLEYVVVHELCHLLVRGHGKDFHDLMSSVMPDWKERREKLR